jgi:acetyltransferase-like isoleucine patch superfamily enzyme
MFLVEDMLNFRRKRHAKSYRSLLQSQAVIGSNFCESKALDSQAIFNCRIKNLSNERERIIIGNNCNLAASIFCNTNGQIIIGDYVYMNVATALRADHLIEIGSHCLFGPRVNIWDSDNHPLSRSKRHEQAELIPLELINSYDASGGPIIIGNDVWVCMDSLILGGVSVGDGSIIAARSVVTRDIPPMSIAAGVPARVIGDVPD